MFRFENVCKTYKSKRGQDCDALRDINLTLPDTGMVILVGRSGSGKSTLLNILGGLDKPTSGEVSFNGNKFSAFSDKDFANYRNNTLGFVFQEFNLIDNIDVGQNVGIPISLQNREEKDSLIVAALEKVGLEGYEKRRINELSGGQKQRVAIARAIVKNPSVILADEPTGNLDKKISKDIFDLLKKLSEEHLVVIVTHDHESAKAYHDYLVEIADGQILFSSCPELEEIHSPLIKSKISLPLSISLKMGFANLCKKPVRSISVLLIALMTIFSVTLSQLFFTYSRDSAQAQIMSDKNINVFSLIQEHHEKNATHEIPVTFSTIDYIKRKYPNLKLIKTHEAGRLVIENAAQLLEFGYEFIGKYEELTNSSVYITDSFLEFMYDNIFFDVLTDDGDYVKLVKSQYPVNEIVGRQIRYSDQETYIIAGIVKNDSLFNNGKKISGNIRQENYIAEYYAMMQFALKNYVNRILYDITIDQTMNTMSFQQQDFFYQSNTEIDLHNIKTLYEVRNYDCIVLSDGTLSNLRNLQLNPSQIIISLELYNKIFNSNLTRFDYLNVTRTDDMTDPYSFSLRMIPQHLNTVIELSLNENGYSEELMRNDYVIAGVSMDFSEGEYSPAKKRQQVFFSSDDYTDYFDNLNTMSLIVNRADITNLKSFLNDMSSRSLKVQNGYTGMLFNIENDVVRAKATFTVLGIVLGIVMIIFVLNLISVSILNRTKELGIMKALGMQNKDLFLIYFIESSLISTISFIICSALSFFGAWLLNYLFLLPYEPTISLYSVNIVTFIIIFLISFVIIFIATLIPLLKIKKMNPVDAIKAVN